MGGQLGSLESERPVDWGPALPDPGQSSRGGPDRSWNPTRQGYGMLVSDSRGPRRRPSAAPEGVRAALFMKFPFVHLEFEKDVKY